MVDISVKRPKAGLLDLKQAAQHKSEIQAYFRGGDSHDRTMSDWQPRLQSADLDLNKFRPKIVARSRDNIRNNGYAQSIMNTFVDNVVGSFFKLSPEINYRLLGMTFEESHELARDIKARWKAFADSSYYYADFYRQSTFAELLKQCLYSYLVSGECLILIRYQKGGRYRVKMQIIEADRLSTPDNKKNDKSIVDGVQLDRNGKPTGYWVRKQHQSESSKGEWQLINRVNGAGRKQVIHVYDQERPEQRRGRGLFAPVLQAFRLLDNYSVTEMERATAQASFAAVIKSKLPSFEAFNSIGGAPGDNDESAMMSYMECQSAYKESYGNKLKIGGVSIPHLTPDEELEMIRTDSPNSAYAQVTDQITRTIAAGTGASYEQVSKDFSKTTYASARTAMIEAHKRFMSIRASCPAKIASELYGLWLYEDLEFVSGYPDNKVPRFEDFPAAWIAAKWIAPGKGEIDPLKQANADEKNLSLNVTTLEEIAAGKGNDIDECIDQKAFENKRLKELGLLNVDQVNGNTTAEAEDDE